MLLLGLHPLNYNECWVASNVGCSLDYFQEKEPYKGLHAQAQGHCSVPR